IHNIYLNKFPIMYPRTLIKISDILFSNISTANLYGRNNSIISQPTDKNKNKGQFFLKYFP
ncbi:MAG: hypothetical protein VX960_00005, partial [Candidatus Neomarinimicrobiota bacterium]|nr:hypothetical protein [Candidatus Neomarinimicrobiota bacterium]